MVGNGSHTVPTSMGRTVNDAITMVAGVVEVCMVATRSRIVVTSSRTVVIGSRMVVTGSRTVVTGDW